MINRISIESVAITLVWLSTIPQATAQQTPNLLLFMANDMTFTDLGCYCNCGMVDSHWLRGDA